MNIFVLHTDPQLAALYHCDQHLNKMIVESAQMLSVAALNRPEFAPIHKHLMKPAYENHPCTVWVGHRLQHMAWVCQLATSLEKLRVSSRENAASVVVRAVKDQLEARYGRFMMEAGQELSFFFCGPEDLRNLTEEKVTTRYRALYLRKEQAWREAGRYMSYDSRPIPEFMECRAEYINGLIKASKYNEEDLKQFYF